MNEQGRWNKVELVASYFLLAVLFTVLIIRLGFAGVWVLPTIDLVLSWLAFAVVIAACWFGRHRRKIRVGAVVFAGLTQLVPMLIRSPVLLLPVLGAAIPVASLIWALVALSRKDRLGQRRQTLEHS